MDQHSTSAYDHLLKILLIGDVESGKRELMRKYIGDEDMSDTTTLGLDYKLKDVMHGGKRIKLQLWDTAGQERFRSVTSSYYRGAHGALLVVALKRDTSFVSLDYWLEEISSNAPTRFQVVLVGIDVGDDDGDTNKDIARQYATEKGLKFVELSLSNQAKVEEAFTTLIHTIMESWKAESSAQESIRLDRTPLEDRASVRCGC